MITPLDQTTLQFIYSLVRGNNLKEDLETYLNFVGNEDPNTVKFINAFVAACKIFKIKQCLLQTELPQSHVMHLSMTTTRTTVIEIIVQEKQEVI